MPQSSVRPLPRGMARLVLLLDGIQADESLPVLARDLFAIHAKEYAQLQAQIGEVDAKLTAWHRINECSQRLSRIPSVTKHDAATGRRARISLQVTEGRPSAGSPPGTGPMTAMPYAAKWNATLAAMLPRTATNGSGMRGMRRRASKETRR